MSNLLSAIRRVQLRNSDFPIRKSLDAVQTEILSEPGPGLAPRGSVYKVSMSIECRIVSQVDAPAHLADQTELAKKYLAHAAYGDIKAELPNFFPIIQEVQRQDWELGLKLARVVERLEEMMTP